MGERWHTFFKVDSFGDTIAIWLTLFNCKSSKTLLISIPGTDLKADVLNVQARALVGCSSSCIL